MQLQDMRFIKLNRDKTPRESLDKTYKYNMVEYNQDLGVMIDPPYVVLDVDDNTEFLKLREIIKAKDIKCNILKTTRGGHFWFKSDSPLVNNIDIKTPIGLSVDIRSHGKKSYTKVKEDGDWREWIDRVYDFEQLDTLPFWLHPINHDIDIVDMKDGEGRNATLYSYIIVLYRYLSKDEIRATYEIINDFILADKVSRKELESILRDEAFENLRPSFFDKKRFMFDEFASWFATSDKVMRRGSLLYIYNGKNYTADYTLIERAMIKHIKDLSKSQRTEVLEYLKLIAKEVPEQEYYYVATNNGILDVRNGNFIDHSNEVFLPQIINANYNPNATTNESVDAFMDKVCEGDSEVIDLMYEMIGYCLIPSSKYQKSFILYGDGSNGKSTLLDMLSALVGTDNTSSLSLSEINNGGFNLAEMTDKLVNVGDDISDEYIKDSSTFKKMVTGDRITVSRKYEHPYETRNTATLIFATNNLPNMRDKSNGMLRRLCVVPFNAVITKADPDFDPFIIDKITTDDALSYVLNKAVEGLSRIFINQGFTEPTSVQELMEDYYRDINNVIQYVELHGVEIVESMTSQDAYSAYAMWCATNAQIAYRLRRFNSEIRKLTGFELENERKNGEVKQVWKLV